MQSLRVSIKEWTFSGFTFPCLPRSSQGGRSLDPRRPRTRLGGGRRAPPAGAAPAPPASRLTSRRRRGLQPPPASRSGTRLPSSRTALERLLSLPGTPRLPTASRPPHPPSPNSPASRRLRDATPVFRALGQRSPYTKQPSRRRTALPGSAQEGQSRRGVERRRPPPAARLAPALEAPREGAVTGSGRSRRQVPAAVGADLRRRSRG